MQVLIVHSDAELGKELMQMVKDYTEHDCDLCPNSAKADAWARRHHHSDFLLTQLPKGSMDLCSVEFSAKFFESCRPFFSPA